jgi:hypothetical protein
MNRRVQSWSDWMWLGWPEIGLHSLPPFLRHYILSRTLLSKSISLHSFRCLTTVCKSFFPFSAGPVHSIFKAGFLFSLFPPFWQLLFVRTRISPVFSVFRPIWPDPGAHPVFPKGHVGERAGNLSWQTSWGGGTCVISGFCRGVSEISALLECYTRRLVVSYRRCGSTYRSCLQKSRDCLTSAYGADGFLATSVTNHQTTLRDIPRRSENSRLNSHWCLHLLRLCILLVCLFRCRG